MNKVGLHAQLNYEQLIHHRNLCLIIFFYFVIHALTIGFVELCCLLTEYVEFSLPLNSSEVYLFLSHFTPGFDISSSFQEKKSFVLIY